MTSPPRSAAGRASRLALAGLLSATGVAHVVVPEAFERIIPRWLPGSRRTLNQLATVAELGSAALLTTQRTARAGGVLAFCTFAGVWIANIQAALQGGYRMLPGRLGGPAVAWLRVPLQLPLLWWAAAVARRTDVDRTDTDRTERPTEDHP